MDAEPAELIALANARFMALFQSGDKESFVRLYTEDSILLLPNIQPLSGYTGAGRFCAPTRAGACTATS